MIYLAWFNFAVMFVLYVTMHYKNERLQSKIKSLEDGSEIPALKEALDNTADLLEQYMEYSEKMRRENVYLLNNKINFIQKSLLFKPLEVVELEKK